MNERELRQRLNDAASAFRFGLEGSELVVRRTKGRILRVQALAAMLTVGAILIVATVLTGQESRVAPQPQPPAGPGPTVTGPSLPELDYVIDINTGEKSPLPEAIIRSLGKTGESGQYAASPDGSLLAYVGTGEEGTLQIFIAGRAAGGSPGIDGTEPRQVTHDPRGATTPAWSPDGTSIAYEGYGRGDVRNLFVLNVATGKSTRVTDESPPCRSCDRNPQFTPDGSSLLYTGGSDRYPVLRTVPVAGGKSTLLIGPGEGVTDAGNGSLSPDGSLVTFLGSGWPKSSKPRVHCGPCRFVANADGTDRRIIPGWVSNPAGTWSPDGSRIVASDGNGWPPTDIVVVDIATEDTTHVGHGRGAIWLDRHRLLVEV